MNEFKFYCSDWTSNAGYPVPWRVAESLSFIGVINEFYSREIKVHDADNGGEGTYLFGVSDGTTTKYFRLDHSWYIDWNPDWNIYNDKTVTEITREEAIGIPGDRDWVELRQTSYPEVKKWPPMALEDW